MLCKASDFYVDLNLLNKVVKFVEPFYSQNDQAHQLDHALDVTSNALSFNASLRLHINTKHIVISGLMHDVKVHEGRKYHHTNAANFMRTELKESWWVDNTDHFKQLMADAVETHRASRNLTEFPSKLAELISSSDRGDCNLNTMLKRFRRNVVNLNDNELMDHIEHILGKYGPNGYCTYPNMYKSMYGSHVIEKLQSDVVRLYDEMRCSDNPRLTFMNFTAYDTY